jgi:hypothetical protein
VVADPRYKREIYRDHGNGLIGEDQTDVLIIGKPYFVLMHPDHEKQGCARIKPAS